MHEIPKANQYRDEGVKIEYLAYMGGALYHSNEELSKHILRSYSL